MIFPGASVDPNRIKAKLRWLLETYYREKKKLSLTGAGMLLEGMDASNLVSFGNLCCLQWYAWMLIHTFDFKQSYISHIALSTKYAWFERMHEMMNG